VHTNLLVSTGISHPVHLKLPFVEEGSGHKKVPFGDIKPGK
jgi:hypothetical protein